MAVGPVVAGSITCGSQLVADIDHGGVADQVEVADDQVVDRGPEELFEVGPGLVLVGVGTVQGDHLMAVPREQAGVVADEPNGFDPRFDYMESAMGGYGLYYATVVVTFVVATEWAREREEQRRHGA